MSERTNLAYDLSRYEYHESKEKKIVQVQKAAAQTISMPKVLGLIVFTGALMCCVLNCKVETAKLQSQIQAKTDKVDILHSENVRMQTQIEGNTSILKVENYAENVLGLKKLDKSQIEYVEVPVDNEIEIPKNNTNIFVTIKNKFYSVLEYIKG